MNRIPLIIDTTEQNSIKELPVDDNLDLTGNSIIGAVNAEFTGRVVSDEIEVNTVLSSEIASEGDLTLRSATGNRVQVTNGPFRLPVVTLSERDELTPLFGDMIYVTDISEVQVYVEIFDYDIDANPIPGWASLFIPPIAL